MNRLISSLRYRVTEVQITGKKGIAGAISVLGLPSGRGDRNEVLSIEDGTVIESGCCYDASSRKYKLRNHVTVRASSGVTLTYQNLATRAVEVGDRVLRGEPIGRLGDRDRELIVSAKRNDRRVDICRLYGFDLEPRIYEAAELIAERHRVMELCGLDEFEAESLSDGVVSKIIRAVEAAAGRVALLGDESGE